VDAVADRLLILENQQITEFEGNWQAWEESRQKAAGVENAEEELTEAVLRMRLSEIIAKMSLPGAAKELLEKEYQKTLRQLKREK
jgi:macrolide transport system ATP-binding/permease protein